MMQVTESLFCYLDEQTDLIITRLACSKPEIWSSCPENATTLIGCRSLKHENVINSSYPVSNKHSCLI